MELNELIDTYNRIKTEYEIASNTVNYLKEELIKELEKRNVKKLDNGVNEVSLRITNTVSYKDESVKVLKEIAPWCVTYKIDNDVVNKSNIDKSLIESHKSVKYSDILTVS